MSSTNNLVNFLVLTCKLTERNCQRNYLSTITGSCYLLAFIQHCTSNSLSLKCVHRQDSCIVTICVT